MYVVAGFHKVVVSIKALRERLGPKAVSEHLMEDSDSEDEDGSEDSVNSVEISNSIWSLDLNTWQWIKLKPGGDPPLQCDKAAAWAQGDRVFLFGGFGPPPGANMMDK